MGTRTEHAPGTFSWVDLSTSDPDAAKEFYGALFGWEMEDNPVPGDGVYTMCKLGGASVAAISGSRPDDPAPPHWNNYVTVESVDDAASKAEELGAQIAAPPFDVMDAGRMAVVIDPTGGAVCLWEARANIGAERVNDPGCLTWNELHTPDVDKAEEFYSGLFGWEGDEMDTGGQSPRYIVVKVGERSNGGIMDAQEGEPPNWMPYFTVESRDASTDRAVELGGTEHVRLEMPAGRIAIVTDPQGAPFALFEGEIDD